MPGRSQRAGGVGNCDASLFLPGAVDSQLGGGHEAGIPEASADIADRQREGFAGEPRLGIQTNSIDGPDRSTSRCSTPGRKDRKGTVGSRLAEESWPPRAWTSSPKLRILDPLGERSPGLQREATKWRSTFHRCLPFLVSLHSFSPSTRRHARARARRRFSLKSGSSSKYSRFRKPLTRVRFLRKSARQRER